MQESRPNLVIRFLKRPLQLFTSMCYKADGDARNYPFSERWTSKITCLPTKPVLHSGIHILQDSNRHDKDKIQVVVFPSLTTESFHPSFAILSLFISFLQAFVHYHSLSRSYLHRFYFLLHSSFFFSPGAGSSLCPFPSSQIYPSLSLTHTVSPPAYLPSILGHSSLSIHYFFAPSVHHRFPSLSTHPPCPSRCVGA